MKFRSIAIAVCSAGALMSVSAPAQAAAYLIGGKWYFFSLDFEASLAKVTGRDLKDGTNLFADVKIDTSNTQCANPQGQLINPGQGPKSTASGTSANVTDADLTRTGNKVTGNVYKTTAKVELPKDPPLEANPCKDANGVSEWTPTYWQFANCSRGTATNPIPSGLPVCYTERARKVNGTLIYATGPLAGTPISATEAVNWTYVYLPTEFRYRAVVQIGGVETPSEEFGACNFPANNESGARQQGLPYSLDNPPVNGWAAYPPVTYVCTAIPESSYTPD